ncbi:hypothetical protein J3459_013986 [Metarhizium acridum]|uniref:V-snare n=1 Tax=Metarhizium acridum (strain CQMa 102) TaxID=655827 RepID=E9EAI4_METAQ|nr:uncharacterized protein MAC_06882 [Metarhizium acridum CQMa 102]EFY87093.1 hypothetical protein MAC_06882 [Metarhizium acridum CQMa 102]KAG8406736.1 hypothetical protein J3458_021068 [Metarhizium acridum]KAG8415928.1 hypothetical protein J3459_013986 [Metarhizium acridum]
MSSKRELSDVDEGEISEPDPKRTKKQTGAMPRHQHQNSSIDPTWGQKYVFSSLEDATTIPYGEESDFEDDSDAMAYLLSVRKEAYDIPHLLVAPKVQIGPQFPPELQQDDEGQVDRNIYNTGAGDDPRGYYDDGAYIAMPEDDEDEQTGQAVHGYRNDERELHEAYFSSVVARYNHLRQMLHSTPPPDAAKRLSSTQETYAAPFGRDSTTNKTWANIMRNTDPHPLQLALMSKETVIRILRVLIGGTFLRRGHTLSERTSQWLWGLLARLPDRGELNHTEIGWVRDLGRRAVLLSRSLAEMAALRDELADGELGVNEGVDASSSDEDVVGTDADDVESTDSPGENDGPAEDLNQESVAGDEADKGDPGVNSTLEGSATGNRDEDEEGEIQESETGDVAMDLDSDSDSDQGGAVDESLEAAKRELLARLDASDAEQELDTQEDNATLRLRMNMRATLNMILTVAGEFYGQRDLLEFREPFVGM